MLILKILGKIAFGFISFLLLVALIDGLCLFQTSQIFWTAFLGFWLLAFFALEFIPLRRKNIPFQRLSNHFRFAPLSMFTTFVGAVIVTTYFLHVGAEPQKFSFDKAVKIQHSKYKIRSYVYGFTPPEKEIVLYLYNDARGCLNGMIQREAELYTETAHEGLTNSSATVRARSLRISIQVYDSFNGSNGLLVEKAEQLAQDEDLRVRQIAEKFLQDIKTN
jgi:hypothetical protein